MKITKELLKRHGLGLCTEAEKKAVEEWFEQHEYPSMHVSTVRRPRANRERIWSRLAQDRPQLDKRMSLEKAKNLVFLNSAMKYAAAACFVIGIFFFGRISVTNVNATEIIDKPPKNLLYVYGENGSYAQIDGERYDIQFDGKLKLHNGSDKPKVILSGTKEFELEPFKTYLLNGSHNDPKIANKEWDDKHFKDLKGNFSIRIIRD